MHGSPLVRRGAALAAASVMLLGITGCGDEAKTAGAVGREPSGAGAGALQAATLETGEEIRPADFAALVSDAFARASTAHLTMTGGGSDGITAEGDVDYASDPVEAAMTLNVPQMGGEVEMRLVDNVIYLRMPMLGDKFVSVDLDSPDNPLGEMLSGLNPGELLDVFEKGVESATYVGEEDVSGETMDHYAAEVGAGALLDGIPQASAAAGQLPDTVVLDVWFDREGLFRKLEVNLGADAGTFQVTFSDWGQDVSIEKPPTDEVTPMPGMPQ